jgi:hypothetical protein
MLESPFPHSIHSYGKNLLRIIEQGHDGIFGNSKPAEINHGLWNIIKTSWAKDPFQRPSMSEVDDKLMTMRGEC